MLNITEIASEVVSTDKLTSTTEIVKTITDADKNSNKKRKEIYVSQFSALAVKTSKSTLEMCRVVYEAKNNLNPSEFLGFCKDIGRKEEDSTIRKYLAIGEAYPRFITYAEHLPNAWTSIYQITLIPAEKFSEMMDAKSNLKNLTGQAIQKLISGQIATKSESQKRFPSALIYFKKEPSVPQWNYFTVVLNKIISECNDLQLYFETTPRYKKLIKDLKKANRENAKLQRKIKVNTKKDVDERNIVYRPDLFDYGASFDNIKGDFI